jgi:hypothetical protein
VEWHASPERYAAGTGLKAAVRALRQGLKISNDESADAADSLDGFALVYADGVRTLAQKKRFLARPFSANARALLEAYAPLSGARRDRIEETEREFRHLEVTRFAPPPLLTGDDLTAAGQSPGPVFKRVLDRVYDAQLEGRVTTAEQALEMGLAIARGERPSA